MSPAASAPRRGRRPGAPDTRAAILEAARGLFATQGFAGTTIRAIGTAAGVDAALVHHYFGSKDDLFVAALDIPVDPRQVLAPVVAGGVEGAGARLLEALLPVWDDPDVRPALLTVARAAMDASSPGLVSKGFLPVVIYPLGPALGLDRPDLRMPLVASQVAGLILLRYVFEVEPLASMGRDQVVATYAPTLQRYLTAELP